MKKIIVLLMICLITSAGFAEFTGADRTKLEKDLKTLTLDKKLPKELTVKEWKKKRKSADLSTKKHKTGIADKLAEIATSYKEISGKKAKNFMFPDILAEVLTAAEVTNAIKIARDQWKELSNFKNKLDELKTLADDAQAMFEAEKQELNKDASKNKKKIAKMQIAIDAAKEIANKADDLSQKVQAVNPKEWRDKFQADKEDAVKFAQGTDELKKSGVKPEKLIQAVFTLDVIFGGKLIDVCDDYTSKVIPELETLRNDPAQLAQKFNGSYLANDAGSRKVSQNTSNIKRWNSNFGADFLYPVTDIAQVITDFDGWGGGTDPWTEENAVENLDKYIRDIEDLKEWAEKYGAQWETDKGD